MFSAKLHWTAASVNCFVSSLSTSNLEIVSGCRCRYLIHLDDNWYCFMFFSFSQNVCGWDWRQLPVIPSSENHCTLFPRQELQIYQNWTQRSSHLDTYLPLFVFSYSQEMLSNKSRLHKFFFPLITIAITSRPLQSSSTGEHRDAKCWTLEEGERIVFATNGMAKGSH